MTFYPTYGYVYLMGDRERQVYKIGYSVDPMKRMEKINKRVPIDLIMIHAIPAINAYNSEGVLHRMFKKFKLVGEWFVLPDEQVERFCSIEKM
jgi:hypothetical protein